MAKIRVARMTGLNANVIVFRHSDTDGTFTAVSNSLKVLLSELSGTQRREDGFGNLAEEFDAVMRVPWRNGIAPDLDKGDRIRDRKTGRTYSIVRISDTNQPFRHRRCNLMRGKIS